MQRAGFNSRLEGRWAKPTLPPLTLSEEEEGGLPQALSARKAPAASEQTAPQVPASRNNLSCVTSDKLLGAHCAPCSRRLPSSEGEIQGSQAGRSLPPALPKSSGRFEHPSVPHSLLLGSAPGRSAQQWPLSNRIRSLQEHSGLKLL